MSSLARLGRRPGVPVIAAFAVTAAYLTVRAVQVEDYIWLVDELLYTKVAQSFAGGEFLRAEIYDSPVGLPNALYPRLLAPLYGLLPSVDAFTGAHVLNALLFASVIFPVYLLARRLEVPRGLAVLVGLCAAWVPWAVAVTVVMTESLAYAAFAWALLAGTVALDNPKPRTHALALLAIGLASYARVQFVVLLVAYVGAVILEALASENVDRRRGAPGTGLIERLRPHKSLAVMLGAMIAVAVVVSATGTSLLGTYHNATDRMRFPPGWLESSAWHLGHIVLGLGLVPAILWLAWLTRTGTTPRSRAELAFAIYGALTVGALVYMAGDFAQNVAGGAIQERYLFYIAPVFLLGAAALLSDRRRPSPGLSLIGAAALVAVVVSIPDYNPTAGGNGFGIVAAAFSGFVRVIEGRTAGLRELMPGDGLTVAELLVVTTFAASILLLVLMRLRARMAVAAAILAAVLVYGASQEHYLLNRAIPSINTAWQGIPGDADTPRDWVDRAVPDDAAVGMAQRNELRNPWLRVEFWNESIEGLYRFPGHGGLTGFRGIPLDVEASTGRVETAHEFPYLVVEPRDAVLVLDGAVVARAAYGLELIRPERPYRALWWAGEGSADGYTTGTERRRFAVHGNRSVALSIAAPAAASGPVSFEARLGATERTGELDPGEATQITMPLSTDSWELYVRASRATRLEDGRSVGVSVTPVEVR